MKWIQLEQCILLPLFMPLTTMLPTHLFVNKQKTKNKIHKRFDRVIFQAMILINLDYWNISFNEKLLPSRFEMWCGQNDSWRTCVPFARIIKVWAKHQESFIVRILIGILHSFPGEILAIKISLFGEFSLSSFL